MTRYQPLSPDGFALTCEATDYASRAGARTALRNWAKRYEAQGYYSDRNREHIALTDLLDACYISEV